MCSFKFSHLYSEARNAGIKKMPTTGVGVFFAEPTLPLTPVQVQIWITCHNLGVNLGELAHTLNVSFDTKSVFVQRLWVHIPLKSQFTFIHLETNPEEVWSWTGSGSELI